MYTIEVLSTILIRMCGHPVLIPYNTERGIFVWSDDVRV